MLKWRAAAEHYRKGGAGRILEVLCARGLLPGWLFHYDETSVLRLRALNDKATMRRGTEYEFGAAVESDVDELARITNASKDPELRRFFAGFFAQGNRCFVVRKDGAIVGYNWACQMMYTITSDNYRKRQLHLLLRPNEALFGNGYIHPDYRLKGLFPGLVRTAVESYPAGTTFYTSVARLNDLSLRSHLRLGFDEILSFGCHRIATLPYFWTVRALDRSRKWLAWSQPTVVLEDLVAKPGSVQAPIGS